KALQAAEARAAAAAAGVKTVSAKAGGGVDVTAILAWAAVGIPLAWGIWITLAKALVLFQ
ncbi:MAG: MFS transporter, partial [Methyloceanibacter sp.]